MKTISRLFPHPLSCALALLILALPGAASAQRTAIDMSSGLLGVTDRETVIVRLVETNRFAQASKITVHFLDQSDRVVQRSGGTVAPGKPLVVELPGKELTRTARGTVRVVLTLEVSDLTSNQPVATVEFFDPQFGFRVGPSCGPGAQPTGPQFIEDCDAFIVDFTAVD